MTRLAVRVAGTMSVAALLFSISAYGQSPPASSPPADVSYRNGPERTGYQDTTPPLPLSLLWRHTTLGVRGSVAGPAASGGTAYFAGGSAVYAVSAKTGATLWQTPAPATVETTPALSGGSLYIGADDGTVLKLDAATGKKLWSVKVGGAVRSSPLVQDGAVYLGSADSHLYALNADTGASVWSVQVGGPVTTSPIAYGNQITFAAADNTLNSVSRTGRLLWSQHLSDDPTPSPPPVRERHGVCGGGHDGVRPERTQRHGALGQKPARRRGRAPDGGAEWPVRRDAGKGRVRAFAGARAVHLESDAGVSRRRTAPLDQQRFACPHAARHPARAGHHHRHAEMAVCIAVFGHDGSAALCDDGRRFRARL